IPTSTPCGLRTPHISRGDPTAPPRSRDAGLPPVLRQDPYQSGLSRPPQARLDADRIIGEKEAASMVISGGRLQSEPGFSLEGNLHRSEENLEKPRRVTILIGVGEF